MRWGQGSYGFEDRDRLEEGGAEGGERVGTGELGKGPPEEERPEKKREEPVEGRAYGRGRGGAPVRETAEGGATGRRRGYRS